MSKLISPIRVTIIDFFASFIPGLFWLALLLLFLDTINVFSINIVSENEIKFAKNCTIALSGTQLIKVYTYFYLFFSFLLGGLIKHYATIPIDYLLTVPIRIKKSIKKTFKNEIVDINGYMFPYNNKYQRKSYFDEINKLITYFTSISFDKSFEGLPRSSKQPFSFCKRLIKLYAPNLWGEVESLEASSRMVSSLLLCSLVAFGMSIFMMVIIKGADDTINILLIVSIITIPVLINLYIKRRHSEVEYVYLNTMVSMREMINKSDLE